MASATDVFLPIIPDPAAARGVRWRAEAGERPPNRLHDVGLVYGDAASFAGMGVTEPEAGVGGATAGPQGCS